MPVVHLLRRAALALAATLSLGSIQAEPVSLTVIPITPIAITSKLTGGLTAASNVDVGGTAYNVQFLDGSCFSIFNGCSASSFVFTDAASANAASLALLAQVLLDGVLGDFDSKVTLTNGCNDARTTCQVLTPYGFAPNGAVMTAVATNDRNARIDSFSLAFAGDMFDTTSDAGRVYAQWSLPKPAVVAVIDPLANAAAANAVPEPASLALVVLALAGLGGSRRLVRRSR